MSLTYVKASCHCGLNTFQIPFVTSELPQMPDMCHCDSCRHITGQMAVLCTVMDGPPLAAATGLTPETHKIADLSKLTMYKASDNVLRYFCPKCFAHLLFDIRFLPEQAWGISAGALEKTDGIVKVGYHQFLGDTCDGGLADHYRVLEGKELPRYEGWEGSNTLPLGWKADSIVSSSSGTKADEDEKLAAYCHCKAISLFMTRGSPDDAKDASKWWIVGAKDDANAKPRFMAGHCFCNSCRLTSGFPIASHIILPRANVFDAHTGLPIKLAIPKDGSTNDHRPKGLKQYESSPGVFRESCGTCGASVFFWSKKAEGGHYPVHEGEETAIIDLHAGLIDEKVEGARAESWCSWYDQVIHPEDAVDKAGMEAVKASIKIPLNKLP